MLLFSAPLVASSLSWWINNASDKYILTYLYGISVVEFIQLHIRSLQFYLY